jgi:hypothetical protein
VRVGQGSGRPRRTQQPSTPKGGPNEHPRTIAIIALIIAVIVLIILLM